MSDKKYIFISYAIEDYFLAKWLAGKLSAEGYYVWMDNIRLKGGDIWKDKINEALSQNHLLYLRYSQIIRLRNKIHRGSVLLHQK